jgi:hypothetical protein
VNSLVLTDIASGGTEAASLVVRESGLLVETLERVRLGLPFALRALDVDNWRISRNGPTRFPLIGPTLRGTPAEPQARSFTRPFCAKQVSLL